MPAANRPTGPSCFSRVKTGALMGCVVGLSAGALFGTFGALRCVCVQVIIISGVMIPCNLDTDYEGGSLLTK